MNEETHETPSAQPRAGLDTVTNPLPDEFRDHGTDISMAGGLMLIDGKRATLLTSVGPPYTRIERALLKGALLIVVAICLPLWFSLLPLWWCRCAYTVVATAGLNVVSIFVRNEPAPLHRLEHAILFWPRGFVTIVRIMSGTVSTHDVERQDVKELVVHTVLAIIFYTTLFFTNELARQSTMAGFSLATFAWRMILR